MGGAISAISLWIALVIVTASAWITHIVICFTDDRWGFLIAGAILFPLGVIHGIGTWFGWW